MGKLRELVERANAGEEKAKVAIIDMFKPLINSLVWKSHNTVETADLSLQILIILEYLNPQKLSGFESDGQIFNYIRNGITNKFLGLIKKRKDIRQNEVSVSFDYDWVPSVENEITCNDIYVEELLQHLTKLQQKVIVWNVIEGRSDVEISEEMNISRQSVHRIKQRALKRLKDNL